MRRRERIDRDVVEKSVNRSFFRSLSAGRTRSSARVTRAQFSPVRALLAHFPLGPRPWLAESAAGRPALVVGFAATLPGYFSCPFILGYGSSPSRCGPAWLTPP